MLSMKKSSVSLKESRVNPCLKFCTKYELKKRKVTMSKKETIKFIVQMIASIATAIVTALGATSCVGTL